MNLITTKELADRLGISTARVRQLAIAGRIIGAHKIGRDWQFTEGARVRLAERTKRMNDRTRREKP